MEGLVQTRTINLLGATKKSGQSGLVLKLDYQNSQGEIPCFPSYLIGLRMYFQNY